MGLTQESLGERCEMSKADISRLENGKLDPRWTAVWRIADALEMQPKFLVADAEDQQRLFESE